jgi:ATP-dependent DNA ligase
MIQEAAIKRPAVFVAFDLLELCGEDLRDRPLQHRREALYRYGKPAGGIHLIEHVETHGEGLFRAIVDGDHEGIVAKRADAPYRAEPQSSWVKIKNRNYSRREAVEWRG